MTRSSHKLRGPLDNLNPNVEDSSPNILRCSVSRKCENRLACHILLSQVPQALVPSKERLRARGELHERLRELIQSYAGHDFDVEDISMLNYAEDLEIAPLDLMIIVR